MAQYTINSTGVGAAPTFAVSSIANSGANSVVFTFPDSATRDSFVDHVSANNLGVTDVSLHITLTSNNQAVAIRAGRAITVGTGTTNTVTFTTGQADFAAITSAGANNVQVGLRVYGGEAVIIFNGSDSVVRFEGNGSGAFSAGIRRQSGKGNNRDAVNGGSRDIDTDSPLTIGARDAVIFENTAAGTTYWEIGTGRTAHGTVAQENEVIHFAPIA